MPTMLSVFTVATWISIAVCTPGTKFPKSLVRDGQESCSFSKSTWCSPKLNEPSLADYSFLAGLMQQNLTRSLPWGLHVLITKAGTAGLQPDVEAFSLFTAAWCSSPVPRYSLRGITVPWGYCVPKGCNSFFLVMAMFCVPFDWVHFFFYGDRASQISISLLDPDINIMTVLREGSSPWV